MSVSLPSNLPVGESPVRVAAKEALWRLSALAFGHPTVEFYDALVAGTFHDAFDSAWSCLTGRPWPRCPAPASAADLEAGYIETFLHGPKGKPVASLLAGDHDHLLAGHARPVFMLNISAFYRHFGLTAATEDEGRTDEPDHLATMLEFMAVLAHLERRALENQADADPYRRAQRDFLRRHLCPMLQAIADQLRHSPRPDHDGTLAQLVAELPRWSEILAAELEVRVGPYRDPENPNHAGRSATTPATSGARSIDQNLWG